MSFTMSYRDLTLSVSDIRHLCERLNNFYNMTWGALSCGGLRASPEDLP